MPNPQFASQSAKHRYLALTVTALSFVMLVVLLVSHAGNYAPAQAPPKEDMPADLALIPGDAFGFVQARVASLWSNELGKRLRQQMPIELALGQKELMKRLGLQPEDIERATIVMRSIKEPTPFAIIATTRPIDIKKLLETSMPAAQEFKIKNKLYYTSKATGRLAMHFVNDRVFLFGMVEDIVQQLIKPAAQRVDSPLNVALRLSANNHQFVAGLNVPAEEIAQAKKAIASQRWDAKPEIVVAHSILPLLETQALAVTIDFKDNADFQGTLVLPNEAAAQEALWVVRDILGLARLLLRPTVQNLDKEQAFKNIVPLLRQVETSLRNARVEQRGNSVELAASLPADPKTLASTVPALIDAINQTQRSAARAASANNLKQIALAMHNYHDTYGTLPPSAIYSKDGKPLLSWRVAILPFVEQDNLYKQFKLDEPWDSPANKALLKNLPPVYRRPAAMSSGATKKMEMFTTPYLGFVGKSAIFEGKDGLAFTSITDGTSNTIMFVEANNEVPWTKPEDIEFGENKELPKLADNPLGGFNAALCDGSVRFFSKKIKPETLKAMITRDGGEVIDTNDLE